MSWNVVEMLPTPMEPNVATGVMTPFPVGFSTNGPGGVPLANFATQALAVANAVTILTDDFPNFGPLIGVVQI